MSKLSAPSMDRDDSTAKPAAATTAATTAAAAQSKTAETTTAATTATTAAATATATAASSSSSASTPAITVECRFWEKAATSVTTTEEAKKLMSRIQAEIFKLFDVDRDGYLSESDYLAMDHKMSEGTNDKNRSKEVFQKMWTVMQAKNAGKITPIEYITFKLRELNHRTFTIDELKTGIETFGVQLITLCHTAGQHYHCFRDPKTNECQDPSLIVGPRLMAPGHSHSHGGVPCTGHGGHGGHGHTHGGGGGGGGHNHSHGGHSHSHGSHGHTHGGGGHSHSHGGSSGHQHSH